MSRIMTCSVRVVLKYLEHFMCDVDHFMYISHAVLGQRALSAVSGRTQPTMTFLYFFIRLRIPFSIMKQRFSTHNHILGEIIVCLVHTYVYIEVHISSLSFSPDRDFCNTGRISMFALDYHLAPELTYPTQLDEAKAAYDYLRQDMAIPANRLVVAGDSAGGHLVLSLLLALNQRSSQSQSKLGGGMLFSPWLSLHYILETNADPNVLFASFFIATAPYFLDVTRAERDETRNYL